MKKYLEAHKWQLVVSVLLVVGGLFGLLPPEVVAGGGFAAVALGTSTAQLGNGTQIFISTGSPTSYVELINCHNIGFDDGTNPQVETTHLGSPNAKEFLPGFADSGKLTAEVDIDMSSAGHIAAQAAKGSRVACDFKIVLPGGTTPTWTARGFVTKFGKSLGVDTPFKGAFEAMITGPWTPS